MNKVFKEHSFANYPTSFRGCIVSPTKICLQFNDAQIKLRINSNNVSNEKLPKTTLNEPYIAVVPTGIDIGCTAVGCQMPVVEDYQMQLIDAYECYLKTHREMYKDVYGKEFEDFILALKTKVDKLFNITRKTYEEQQSNGL